jgi:hypothetical protein
MAMRQYAGPLWLVDHDSVLIDLGDMSEPERPPGPDPLAAVARKAFRAVALMLVVLASAGASAPGRPVLSAPLWSAELSLAGFSLGSDYVAGTEPGGRIVLGRDIRTGQTRWEVEVDDPPQYTAELSDHVLVIVTRDRPSDDAGNGQQISLLVGGAGTVLSRIVGNQFGQTIAGGRLLVATNDGAAEFGCPDGESCTDVVAFDLGTSAPAWRRTLPGTVIPGSGVDEAPSHFATVRADGSVALRDPATGSAVAEFSLPVGGRQRQVAMIGDLIVTAVRGPDGAELVAYHTRPVGPAWTLTVPASPTVTDATARFYLQGCGAFICLHVDGGNAIVDAGGHLRGLVGLEVIGQAGPLLVAVPTGEAGSGLTRRVVSLLSNTDGQEVRSFRETVVVPWTGSGGRVLLASQGAERTGFLLVDGTGRVSGLGGVPGVDLFCQARGATEHAYLACVDPVGRLRVWRLPD